VCVLLEQICKQHVEITFSSGMKDENLLSESGRRHQEFLRKYFNARVRRIKKHTDDSTCGHQFAQQLQLFRVQFARDHARSRGIPSRSAHAGNKPARDRIDADKEDDGNRSSRGGSRASGGAAPCNNYSDLTTDQISRQLWQSLVLAFCPTIFDGEVLAFYVTGLTQALAKSS